MDKLAKELTLEMFKSSELYYQIAEAIGPENFYKLTRVAGGTTIYIPKPESIIRPVRDAHIKEEFNGYNLRKLVRKYNVTERWVRQICDAGQSEGQIDLFSILMDENKTEDG